MAGVPRLRLRSSSIRRCRDLNRLDEVQQFRPVDQPNRLTGSELAGVGGESSCSYDDRLGSALGGQNAELLPDNLNANGSLLPLLALDQGPRPVSPKHQVHTAVSTTAQGFLDLIAFAAEGLTDHEFEVLPRCGTKGFEAGLPVDEGPSLRPKQGAQDRDQGEECERIGREWPGPQGKAFDHWSFPGTHRRKHESEAQERDRTDNEADPPRGQEEKFKGTTVSALHVQYRSRPVSGSSGHRS